MSFLLEEISEESDIEDFERGEGHSTSNDPEISDRIKGFSLPISQVKAQELYDMAGHQEDEVNNDITIIPSPSALTTAEEILILRVKDELKVSFELDKFQVAALVALQQGRNVVLVAPCGSGKMIVFYLGVEIMRVKLDKPKGVGICLQPLNNILRHGNQIL